MADDVVTKRRYKRELIVFGYIRRILPKQIPTELKKLCLSFYSMTEWDADLHGACMDIVDGGNCVRMIKRGWGSAYLTGEYSQGAHHWTFKLKHGPFKNHYFLIGIWKTKSAETPTLDRYFTDTFDNGYAYDIEHGRLTNPLCPGGGGPLYGVKCKAGDVIEMYLDFGALMLSFAVNGTHYPNGQTIERTEYKPAITMHGKGDELRLVSYDNVKVKSYTS